MFPSRAVAAGLAPQMVVLSLALLAGCTIGGGGGQPAMQGYVEGDYVNVAPEEAGRIATVLVSRGQRVAAGDVLFKLTDAEQISGVAEARARVDQAQAQLMNLQSGKRPEELAVLDAQLTQANAALTAADADFQRASQLFATRVVPQAQVDAARERRDTAAAQVAAAQRQIDAAKLSARPEEITAAQQNLAAVQAAQKTAELHLARRTVSSMVTGLVDNVFFNAGESVGAAQPVISILPDNGRKIRFFVPETRLMEITAGDRVAVGCDGCAAGLEAEVTFVATQPEFTPPVIYSRDNRTRLVFRAEAKPLDQAATLTVGLPVDVRPAQSARVAVRP